MDLSRRGFLKLAGDLTKALVGARVIAPRMVKTTAEEKEVVEEVAESILSGLKYFSSCPTSIQFPVKDGPRPYDIMVDGDSNYFVLDDKLEPRPFKFPEYNERGWPIGAAVIPEEE